MSLLKIRLVESKILIWFLIFLDCDEFVFFLRAVQSKLNLRDYLTLNLCKKKKKWEIENFIIIVVELYI
jgi:hypothetical protein